MENNHLRLASIFSDGMVLQRDKDIAVWGQGADGTQVSASLGGVSASAIVKGGAWRITLPPLPAAESCELVIVSSSEEIRVQDVAIGEVWIAGGQSNMEMQLRLDAEAAQSIASAHDPAFRFFDVPRIFYEGQEMEEDFSSYGFWRPCTPAHAPHFSAAAFYYGRMLRDKLGVPVGIIGCNVGGTSASCWMPEADLRGDTDLKKAYLTAYENAQNKLDIKKYERNYRRINQKARLPQHQEMLDKVSIGQYSLLRFLAVMALHGVSLGMIMRAQALGPMSSNRPCALYHSMLETIIPYTVRGVIWYQGEADFQHPGLYDRLFAKMIERWRSAWGKELPFLFVQLAPFGTWLFANGKNYPALREQQDIVSKTVPKAYMASIMDCGEKRSIHPQNKRPVGERLALLALGKVYGQKILCEPPEAVSAHEDGGKAVIAFSHAGDGLNLRGNTIAGLQVFDRAGREFKYFTTKVGKESLHIHSHKPIGEIRFAWQGFVAANLYNSAGLCAKPFRFDLRRI